MGVRRFGAERQRCRHAGLNPHANPGLHRQRSIDPTAEHLGSGYSLILSTAGGLQAIQSASGHTPSGCCFSGGIGDPKSLFVDSVIVPSVQGRYQMMGYEPPERPPYQRIICVS
jgi:hypothetical protein